MGVVVLIVLAAVWAAFLLPPILRARAESRPAGSISDFRRQLRVLGRTSPTTASYLAPTMPSLRAVPAVRTTGVVTTPEAIRRRRTMERRRNVFFGLLSVMGGSLVLGLLPPLRVLWVVHVFFDLLFVAYVAALLYMRNLAAERDMKVRFLPTTAAPEPAYAMRRAAN